MGITLRASRQRERSYFSRASSCCIRRQGIDGKKNIGGFE